ncbi:MAG: adenosylcobinamide-GDP ribazoletransferase [Dehalococcoidia bacterium]
MGFWTAWQFLTIFPGPSIKDEKRGLGSSLPWFPIIGLILGGILLGLDQLFDLFLPQLLNSALLVVALVILTGALHLDGFMDTCDGFAVKSSAVERLKVMADSHAGGFGVAGGCCLLIVKFTAICSLPIELLSVGLLLMPAIARWSVAYTILAFPSARKGGLGDLFKGKASWTMALIATIITLGIAAGFLGWIGLALVTGIWATAYLVAKGLSFRLGGLTGDTYGAVIELAEVCVLIAIVIIGKAGGTSWLDLSS